MASETTTGKAGIDKAGTGKASDNALPARHPWGPRPLGAVLPVVVRPAYRRRSPAAAQLLADWESIVGPAIAQQTTPRKLFAGTLVIVCAGPVAMELQHLSDVVMARINTHLGRVAVTRLRFVQDVTANPAPLRRPALATVAARRAVAGLPEGELRDALERLGRVVLAAR